MIRTKLVSRKPRANSLPTQIIAILRKHGPMTAVVLHEVHFHTNRRSDISRALHQLMSSETWRGTKRHRRAYIKAWERSDADGRLYLRAVYAAGVNRLNAEKPPRLTQAEVRAKAAARRSEQESMRACNLVRRVPASVFHLGPVQQELA
jgi:hypothetical protein